MRKPVLLTFTIGLAVSFVLAQREQPPSTAALAEITARGRLLAEYDGAAWHATDAVQAMKPAAGSVTRFVARKTDRGWSVVFGRFDDQRTRFLIAYEATQGARPEEFSVQAYEPPQADTGFYFTAALAVETVLADFRGEKRPYNIAVLPAGSGQLYVYVVPAQTEYGVFPLGGDVRYLVSPDGSDIVAKRRMHQTIIEFTTPPEMQKVETGYHIAVLDDIPEDTDVFHVLVRTPSVPEWIVTPQYVYRIDPDGTIHYVMTKEGFMKIKDK
ncbi:MAG: hypothetical protein JXQ27_13220 [Acidobacteria bacterium]|nr:hypothetical protein [Acidobacteriota bacterium]